MDALSTRHAGFVNALFSCGMNASEALRRIGYSGRNPDVQSAKIMARADVRAEIARRRESMRMTNDFEMSEALSVLAGIARDPSARNSDKIKAVIAWKELTGCEAPKKSSEPVTLSPWTLLSYLHSREEQPVGQLPESSE